MKCPDGFVYNSSASACPPATCSDQAFVRPCKQPNIASCVCPTDDKGKAINVELGNKCVLREDCQCIDSSFDLHQVS